MQQIYHCFLIGVLICAVSVCAGMLMQEAKAAEITGSQSMDLKTLHILLKTDRGYYSPGDIIRVKGTITGVTGTAVQAQVLFSFQGMNTTTNTTPDGTLTAQIPISLSEPENLYRLYVSANAEGYEEKNLSIPIVIMGEPSSLAPALTIPDEFAFT